jgi:hypothetical protein
MASTSKTRHQQVEVHWNARPRRCLWLFPLQIEKSDAEIIAMERKAAEIAEATVAKAKLTISKDFPKPKRQ